MGTFNESLTRMIDEFIITKSCSNCKHSINVRMYSDTTLWNCDVDLLKLNTFENKGDFVSFYCSKWVNVFEKNQA